jgi:hypothetical protein
MCSSEKVSYPDLNSYAYSFVCHVISFHTSLYLLYSSPLNNIPYYRRNTEGEFSQRPNEVQFLRASSRRKIISVGGYKVLMVTVKTSFLLRRDSVYFGLEYSEYKFHYFLHSLRPSAGKLP